MPIASRTDASTPPPTLYVPLPPPHREDRRLDEVVDVRPATRLLAVAVEVERLAGQRAQHAFMNAMSGRCLGLKALK